MNKIILFCLCCMLVLFACKSKQKVDEHAGHNHQTMAAEPQNEKVNTIDSLSYLKVSFFSIGSGTDGKTRTAMLSYLEQFQSEKKIKLNIETRRWGREGEIDYCIQINNLIKIEQQELRDSLSKLFEGKELVRMGLEKKCLVQ